LGKDEEVMSIKSMCITIYIAIGLLWAFVLSNLITTAIIANDDYKKKIEVGWNKLFVQYFIFLFGLSWPISIPIILFGKKHDR